MDLDAGRQPVFTGKEGEERSGMPVVDAVGAKQYDLAADPVAQLLHVAGPRSFDEIGERVARNGSGWAGVVDDEPAVRRDGDLSPFQIKTPIAKLRVLSEVLFRRE